MKIYEPATLVELGDASELVLGFEGNPIDGLDPEGQLEATLLDVD